MQESLLNTISGRNTQKVNVEELEVILNSNIEDIVYTGAEIEPDYTLTYNNVPLTSGDYEKLGV